MKNISKSKVYSVVIIICAVLFVACGSYDYANAPEQSADYSQTTAADETPTSPIASTDDNVGQQDIYEADEAYKYEQTTQEIAYEQSGTAEQYADANLYHWEAKTSDSLRHISELGLTYNDSIPNLVANYEVRYIMLHHTVGLFETDGSLVGMHNDHKTRAALDGGGIAYSEIIQKDGTVWIARGSLRPSHTGVSQYIRSHSYSITVSGNFDLADSVMPQAQLDALKSRVAAAMRQFPNATIVGHSDLAATACPGTSFPWDSLEQSLGAVRGTSRTSQP